MHRFLRVLVVVIALLPIAAVEATPAGAAAGTTCKSLGGSATVTPGLPKYGSTQTVRPTISIKGAKVSGCRGAVKGATASATLKFDQSANCTSLITQIAGNVKAKAKGTASITWNNHKTSKVSFSLTFGSVPNNPSVAKLAGTVTAGLFVGMKETGSVAWSLGSDECFGGAPLTSFTFSGFSPFVTK
jgi:hypothetical protein